MTPHRCPVCAGRGTVPDGFYSEVERPVLGSTAPETCRSCGGQGYVLVPAAQSPGGYTYSVGYRVVGSAKPAEATPFPKPEQWPPKTKLSGALREKHWRDVSPLMREASNGCYCDACMETDERANGERLLFLYQERPRD